MDTEKTDRTPLLGENSNPKNYSINCFDDESLDRSG